METTGALIQAMSGSHLLRASLLVQLSDFLSVQHHAAADLGPVSWVQIWLADRVFHGWLSVLDPTVCHQVQPFQQRLVPSRGRFSDVGLRLRRFCSESAGSGLPSLSAQMGSALLTAV
jgi:hypothetical protein